MNLEIGDRVKIIAESPLIHLGAKGVIIEICPHLAGVQFDTPIYGGHSLDGRGRNGYCRWVRLDFLDLSSNNERIYEDVLI